MLRELQRGFARAVFEGDPSVVAQILPGRFPAAQHLQIYGHNITSTLSVALAAIYPTVEKLVSPGFFGYAAHEYLRDHRPMSANLHDFGGAFAEFLAGFPPAAGLAYLPDVARLEWAWHRAFHAADAATFDPATLANVAEDRQPLLRFTLHPSAQLIASAYPIVRIFEVNQDGHHDDMAVDLTAGGDQVLVCRRELRVCVERLTAGDAALLTAFQQNRTLGEALEAALMAQPDFDLAATLTQHAQRGTLVRALNN